MKQTTPQKAIEAKAASIRSIKKVQRAWKFFWNGSEWRTFRSNEEYQNITFNIVSDDVNNHNLSQYLANKQRFESFKNNLKLIICYEIKNAQIKTVAIHSQKCQAINHTIAPNAAANGLIVQLSQKNLTDKY